MSASKNARVLASASAGQISYLNSEELPRVALFDEVQSRVGLSRSAIFDLTRRGEFPKPIKLTPSGKRVGYLVSEINQWFQERAAERA